MADTLLIFPYIRHLPGIIAFRGGERGMREKIPQWEFDMIIVSSLTNSKRCFTVVLESKLDQSLMAMMRQIRVLCSLHILFA